MSYPHYPADCKYKHDLVRDFGGTYRPPIIVLCGSTRHMQAFEDANRILTATGHIVLSVGCNMKVANELWSSPADAERIKQELDELHMRKIDLADRVLVLNEDGYMGQSTRNEIAYAQALGKPIDYLVPWVERVP